MNRQAQILNLYNELALKKEILKKKSRYYHQELEKFYRFIVPEEKTVLEIGSGTGDLLSSLKPKKGIGIDFSIETIKLAKKLHPKLKFIFADVHKLPIQEKFEYIIMSDLIGNLDDVQIVFNELRKVSTKETRIVINFYNFLWEPILQIAEKLNLKLPQGIQNWLSNADIENLLQLSGFEVIKRGTLMLIPVSIPFISNFVNKYLARLPLIEHLCITQYFIVRLISHISLDKEYSVSVIIPARNEAGNIEEAVLRTPKLGSWTEIIFVEGGSKDDTLVEIKSVISKYKGKRKLSLIEQGKGRGKGDAVRKGFARAKGEILMILDADLTMPPEELPKYYEAIREGKGEFVMGSRLVYPMEKEAMRFLNILGNKFFSIAFSFLLDQRVKDTLCGTKVLFKRDYQQIVRNRMYFGDFDPFGDFDLIFGASKLNLKISEIPIRYKARTYGTTNISRFKHGLLLLKMVLFASRKIKFF